MCCAGQPIVDAIDPLGDLGHTQCSETGYGDLDSIGGVRDTATHSRNVFSIGAIAAALSIRATGTCQSKRGKPRSSGPGFVKFVATTACTEEGEDPAESSSEDLISVLCCSYLFQSYSACFEISYAIYFVCRIY